MRRSIGALLLGVIAFPVVAWSGDAHKNGFYFGAGVGGGRIEADLVDLMVVPTETGESLESDEFKTTGIAGKFFAGYRILEYLAIEAAYTKIYEPDESLCFVDDSGECAEERGGPLSIASSAAWTVEVPLDGWTAYVVGIFPFNDSFEIFGKVGAFIWEADINGQEGVIGSVIPPKPPFIPETNSPINLKADGEDLALGAGVNFNTDSGVSIRSEFEWFDVDDTNAVWVFSVSAFYNF